MEEIFHLFFPELGTTSFFNNSVKHVKKKDEFSLDKKTFSTIMDKGQGSGFFKTHFLCRIG
jgi:hypothetical protein